MWHVLRSYTVRIYLGIILCYSFTIFILLMRETNISGINIDTEVTSLHYQGKLHIKRTASQRKIHLSERPKNIKKSESEESFTEYADKV